jgi:3-polyprenyl-4-hydroxybenzoate decarboxylase
MNREYSVILLDAEGYELTERLVENLKQAKAEMKYLLSNQYALACENTHADMRTHKAETRNASGEVVLDEFYAV